MEMGLSSVVDAEHEYIEAAWIPELANSFSNERN